MTATETHPKEPRSWEEIRDEKRAEQLGRIPEAWRLPQDKLPAAGTSDLRPFAAASGLLSDRELLITSDKYDATALAEAIAQGTYSATEVVTAFCKRAAIAQQLCHCLTEICFAEAIEAAKKLDEQFAATGKTVGPLHGVPMTFKECFHVKGFDHSNGYIARCFNKSTTTTPMIELVQGAGAVIISKTNVPQTMLVADCDNNVFGHTKNPVASALSPGGSSGGEGALAAFRGTALGMGTDVGGSIRVPAAYNGVYGYKPSVGVLPFIGYAPSGYTGVNTGIPAVLGPLAQSVRDIRLLTKTARAQAPWTFDPAVIPGVMEYAVEARQPVVGILYKSALTPHPPILRGLREARAKLEAAGYTVVDFTPRCPDFQELRDVSAQLLTADGLSYQRGELAKAAEPAVPSVVNFGYWELPRKTPEQIWEWNTRRGAIQKQMLDAWHAAGIDVLLAPTAPHTAIPAHMATPELYTLAWNAVDYPSVILPVGAVDPKIDLPDPAFAPLSDNDAKIQSSYDPAVFAGAPISLQLVGERLKDSALLQYAEEIDAVLNGQ